MIKIYYSLIGLFWAIFLLVSPCYIEAAGTTNIFNWGATDLLDEIYKDQKKDDTVQETAIDHVNSVSCNEPSVGDGFTISRTLCYIKQEMHNYLQYVVYIGLSAAVIFLIWNGLKIITSSNKETQMWEFKKNLKKLIIWVVILVAFYAIIEIFVSIVNLLSPGA